MSLTIDSKGYVEAGDAASSMGMERTALVDLRRRRPKLFPNAFKSSAGWNFHASDIQSARATLLAEKKAKPLRGERFLEYREQQYKKYL